MTQLKDEKTKDSTPRPNRPVSPTHTRSLPTPKLSHIEIPKFDGDVAKWSAFWDIFDSLIHSCSDLKDVVKFTTLRSHLTGRAFKTIEGIPVTHVNYNSAVDLLKGQFCKSDKLIT